MQADNESIYTAKENGLEIVAFSNQTRQDRKLLKKFVDFHWEHYHDEPQYIPLFDYEYLGFRLVGITGFFEPRNLFFKHAEIKFFLAYRDKEIVGRCVAFVNHDHNKHWNDKVGFFGHFESIDDQRVTDALVNAAREWLHARGMDTMRGPQNLPVNEATPGIMTDGFDTRPVIYYSYNKRYYEKLMLGAGLEPIKKVFSWEVPVMNPMEEKLERVVQKIIDRYNITIESWDERPYEIRKKEMLEIYNDAWNDNFGFIPFSEEEFYTILEAMKLILDKGLFQFLYIKGEPAAFLGAVPNIFDKMKPGRTFRRWEFLRLVKMFFTKGSIKGFRLGYLGVKKKYQHLGLDGAMIKKQKIYTQENGFVYSDLGWVLEDNVKAIRTIEMMGPTPSKTYTIFEKKIEG